jgi:Domain of unknown function (DUF4062)
MDNGERARFKPLVLTSILPLNQNRKSCSFDANDKRILTANCRGGLLMPKLITQYRVFIASPGGLADERERFRTILDNFSLNHGWDKDVEYKAVGWEDSIGGAGRPQELINEDLKQCDYAVFILHDRWGSPTGSGYTSGTEEEWALVEELYKENKIRNIALFFKSIDAGKLSDPGEQLKHVLTFKNRIESEKRYLFKNYTALEDFVDTLGGHLARWLREHDKARVGATGAAPISGSGPAVIKEPDFDYWIDEVTKLLSSGDVDSAAATFCSKKAIDSARTDLQWARANNSWGGRPASPRQVGRSYYGV